jgi:hypothetical protein
MKKSKVCVSFLRTVYTHHRLTRAKYRHRLNAVLAFNIMPNIKRICEEDEPLFTMKIANVWHVSSTN